MKFRRTVSSIIVSIFLVIAVLLVVVQFRLATYGMDKVQSIVQSFIPSGDLGIEVTMDGLEGTLMKSIKVNDILVKADGNAMVKVGSVDVSLTIWDVVRLAFGKAGQKLKVTVSDVDVFITDQTVGSILRMVDGMNSEGGETASSETRDEGSSGEGKGSPIEELGFDISVRNLNVYAVYKGLAASSKGINATAVMDKGLSFKGADLNIPLVSAMGGFLGDTLTQVRDVRVSVDENYVGSLSIAKIRYGQLLDLDNTSALAELSEGVLSAAMYIESAGSKLAGEGLSADLSLDSTTLNANYSFKERTLGFGLETEDVSATAKISDNEVAASIKGLSANGAFDGKESLSLDLGIDGIDASFDGYAVDMDKVGAEVSFNASTLGSIGQFSVESTAFKGLERFLVDSLSAKKLLVDYSYSSSGLGIRVTSGIEGHVENQYLGGFSTNLDAIVQTSDFKSLEVARMNLNDIVLASNHGAGSLSVELTDDGLELDLLNAEDLELYMSYLKGELSFGLNLNELKPLDYELIYDNLLSGIGIIDSETALNGSASFSIKLSQEMQSFLDGALSGSFGDLPQTEDLRSLVEEGRASINTAFMGIAMGDSHSNGALTFEASFDRNYGKIDTLAVTMGGVRVSYTGSVDFSKLIPTGTLYLQNAGDGSEIANVVLTDTEGIRQYDYLLTSPLMEDLVLSGTIDWRDVSNIAILGLLQSNLIGDGAVDFNAVLKTDPFSFKLDSDDLKLEASLVEGLVDVTGQINKLKLSISDSLKIGLDSKLKASFRLSDSHFEVTLDDFLVSLPDLVDLGFALKVTNNSLLLDKVLLGKNGQLTRYEGSVDLTFNDISSLFKLDTSSVLAKVALDSETGLTYLKSAIKDDQFYIDFNHSSDTEDGFHASLQMTGQRQNEFYAMADIGWGKDSSFTFNAVYNDSVISLFDSKGHMGSLQVNDIKLVLDFSSMNMESSLQLKNEKTFQVGDIVTQSALVSMNAKIETLATGILQLFAGQDYTMNFDFDLKDIELADGFSLPDIDLDVEVGNGVVRLGGEEIHGTVDLANRSMDLVFEDTLLFSLKARGSFGDELDILLSDINFPLPILNQFLDSPIFSFVDGTIVGDVLVKGPASNPSLYGMAYCQSYAMDIFFIPSQILTIKNAAISFVDHSMVISETPLTGYSDLDGRYFNGSIALEIVLQNLKLDLFDIKLKVNENTPIDFWLPVPGDFEFEIRADLAGSLNLGFSSGRGYFNADLKVSSTLIDFRIEEELPSWYSLEASDGGNINMDIDLKLTTGKDVEFYYPEKDNSFINFTLDEDKTVEFIMKDGKFSTDGGLAIKTGQVYYFHNDFIIKQGSVDLSERNYSSTSFPLLLNLSAEITDYDSDGNKVVINLILQNSTLDNIQPRFTSTPNKDENEILAMLGQSVLSSSALDQAISLSSLASFAATATETLQRVGILESNKSYSIGSTIRNALGLDIFSARSSIVSNIIIDALPGELTGRNDVSMLARYLDNTSIFAGKYVGEDWFIKIRLMLKADNSVRLSDEVGHFLAKDLILDTEISLDWDTPMGTISVFTYPQELSVFDILDTIGFSVTKQIQF